MAVTMVFGLAACTKVKESSQTISSSVGEVETSSVSESQISSAEISTSSAVSSSTPNTEGSATTTEAVSTQTEGKIGEWMVADAYNTQTKTNDNVDVQGVKISDDKELIDSVISEYSGIYDLSDHGEGNKYIYIECNVKWSEGTDIGEFTRPHPSVNLTDKDTLDGGKIKYNGITMITRSVELKENPGETTADTYNYIYLSVAREDTPLDILAVSVGQDRPVYFYE